MKKMQMKSFAVAAVALLLLPACEPITMAAAGVGAATGVAAAQDGGVRGAISDKMIYVGVTDRWVNYDKDMYRRLALEVTEGRVLAAGSVKSADDRVEAVRLAWQVPGVKQVINEITVDEDSGLYSLPTDSWVTTSLNSKFLLDKDIHYVNYNIETIKGTVYLIGVAGDQYELDKVLETARNTSFVKNVVSYVRLRGEVAPGALQPDTGVPLDQTQG